MVPWPKPIRYQNPDYLAMVRAEVCLAYRVNQCEGERLGHMPGRSEAHHSSLVDGTGTGTKSSDLSTYPLCLYCHSKEEAGAFMEREVILREICRLLQKWIREGEK